MIPIFTYGTLRVGQHNYNWCAKAVKHADVNVTADGRIYYVMGRGYPVAKFDESGKIKGDVLWFDPSTVQYQRVVEMEINAGYTVREITVVTDDGKSMECLGFHYLHIPRGEWIPSGDWVADQL